VIGPGRLVPRRESSPSGNLCWTSGRSER